MNRHHTTLLIAFLSLPAAFGVSACSEKFNTCENTLTCSEGGATASGGSSSGGDSGETGGASSGGSGTGGEAPETCSPACADNEKCVNSECVECTSNTDCSGDNAVCDTEAGKCVGCVEQTDCTDAAASVCTDQSCTACTGDADCAHIEGKGVCDAGTCVQCTGTSYASCGTDSDSGKLFICDSLAKTCSTTEVEAGVGLCETCVSDANCKTGQRCAMQSFEGSDVGYFCFWERAAGGGAPAECFPGARPYVDELSNTRSIDGVEANLCGLAVTTCPALNDFRALDCAPGTPPTPNDDLCGVEGVDDGYCAQINASTYRCTVPCGSNDDCRSGFDCDLGATPAVCEL